MTQLSNRKSSVDRTLLILGDRWIYLILGEAFFGVRGYDEFQSRLGIATNILSNRLKKLVKHGIMEKEKNPKDGRRFIYRLTKKGLNLYPIPLAMMSWGDRWLSGTDGPPLILHHKSCGKSFQPVMCCSECGEAINARDVSFTYTLGAHKTSKR